MRHLVIAKIIRNYEIGLTGINLKYLRYNRKKKGQPDVIPYYYDSPECILTIDDLKPTLLQLEDDELLRILDYQAYQNYR